MTGLRAAIVPVTLFQQNCTLLYDEQSKRGAVVDPGGDLDRVRAAIAKVGMTVEQIVLTHGHIDHAGGARGLADDLGVPIWGPHQADRFLLDGLPAKGLEYGIADAKSVVPDRWLDEGERIAIAGQTFEIFHCPGHSPGSVVLVDRLSRFAQMGDVLFQGSVGRTDLPYGDHEALIRAIKDKLLPLGDDIAFIPGHGPMSTLGAEREQNPFIA